MQYPRDTEQHLYGKAFFSAFCMFLLSMLPILIMTKGAYISMGDYNVQGILSVEHIANLLHGGGGLPAFDWTTSLGNDFTLSYGCYFFSPFNWLLYLFPVAWLPYVHTLVVAVKMGFGAVGGVLYTRQYLKTDRAAFLCGMLYAFSGYQLYNLSYQFIDNICLFPFLLYAFDQLVTRRKPLAFALLLCINGLISFYFLWEECLFIMLYFFVRMATKSFPKLDGRLFTMLAIESLTGVGLCAFVMIPAAKLLATNPRVSNTIFDGGLLAYQEHGVIWHIIQSLVLPPELCGMYWYFPDRTVALSNPALYLPFFSCIGVMAILHHKKKSWFSVLVTVCGLVLCIPVLNSSFSLFNGTFYARWLYMPLLVMVLMTGMYIEEMEHLSIDRPFKLCAGCTALFIALGVYTVYRQPESRAYSKNLWLMSAVLAVVSLLILYCILHPQPKLPALCMKNLTKIVCAVCCAMFFVRSFCICQAHLYCFPANIQRQLWNDFQPVVLPDDSFFRINNPNTKKYNTGLNWGYPTLDTFNSMVSGYETRFYHAAGVERYQNLIQKDCDYALDSFLSVKYFFYCNQPLGGGVTVEPEHVRLEREGYSDYTLYNNYLVYHNDAYIPMGYTFDYYLDVDEMTSDAADTVTDFLEMEGYDDTPSDDTLGRMQRQKLLLKAIWLDSDQIERYQDILSPLPDDLRADTSVDAYYADCAARAASACDSFVPSGKGFDASIQLEKPNLVFFSVPYSEGFTAYVDGQETPIEQVFDGLCAVYVPAGQHAISFAYESAGLRMGLCITGGCGAVCLLYGGWVIMYQKRKPKTQRA